MADISRRYWRTVANPQQKVFFIALLIFEAAQANVEVEQHRKRISRDKCIHGYFENRFSDRLSVAVVFEEEQRHTRNSGSKPASALPASTGRGARSLGGVV